MSAIARVPEREPSAMGLHYAVEAYAARVRSLAPLLDAADKGSAEARLAVRNGMHRERATTSVLLVFVVCRCRFKFRHLAWCSITLVDYVTQLISYLPTHLSLAYRNEGT